MQKLIKYRIFFNKRSTSLVAFLLYFLPNLIAFLNHPYSGFKPFIIISKKITDSIFVFFFLSVCGLNPTDIIFMLDESTSIWDKDYSKQMDFLVSFIKDAIIGQKNTQIGVVTFSTGVVNRIYLNQYQKRRGLLDAVKAIQRYHGDTYTDKGLRYITGAGFAAEHGGRPGVPHIVIVITDGQSTRPIETKSAAKEMHNAGITVFAIGVGSAIDPDELKTISGDQSRVYEVISYDALKNIESALFSKVCTVERIKVGH